MADGDGGGGGGGDSARCLVVDIVVLVSVLDDHSVLVGLHDEGVYEPGKKLCKLGKHCCGPTHAQEQESCAKRA